MRDLEVKLEDVRLVLMKHSLLTSAKLSTIKAAGREPVTSDTHDSMAFSRYDSTLDVGSTLDEVPRAGAASALLSKVVWSAKASYSSRAELENNHIFVLDSDPKAPSSEPGLQGTPKPTSDAIGAEVILELLSQVKRGSGKLCKCLQRPKQILVA